MLSGIVAQNRPLGDLREILVLGDGNRQAFEAVDVQHDVDVRTAVPDIDDVVLADCGFLPQMVEDCDLAVSGSQAFDVADFAVFVIGKPAGEDVLRRYDAFQRRFHDFLRSRGNDVGCELVPLQFAKKLNEQRNVRI